MSKRNQPKIEAVVMRLQKRMAQLGIASRRESERLIAAGRIKVNGKLVTELGTKVTTTDKIAYDGQVVEPQREPVVGLLNKPLGCLCSRTDPEGRETIYDHIPMGLPFLAHVGRLDYNTEGALLMTTDGDLAQALLRPANGIPRTYEVKIRGHLNRTQLLELEKGVPLDGRATKPIIVERVPGRDSKHDWLSLTLFEGKNRHVHRIIEAVGSSVSKLQRVSFAGIDLEGLRPGRFRLLDPPEVASLRAQVRD